MLLTDSADNNLRYSYVTFDLVAGETSTAIIIKAEAATGRTLQSGSHLKIRLKARETESGDPYTDLATGIDLSGFTPGVVSFDLICEADASLTGLVRAPLALVTTINSAAGWTV